MKCEVCGRETTRVLCDECEYHIKNVNGAKNGKLEPSEKSSIEYIKDKINSVEDSEVRANLEDMVSKYENYEVVSPRNSTTHNAKSKHYSSANGWVGVLRIFTTLIFLALILAGVMIAIDTENPLIAVIGIFVAFFTVAGSMIFLGIADDIRKSRALLEEIRDLTKNK